MYTYYTNSTNEPRPIRMISIICTIRILVSSICILVPYIRIIQLNELEILLNRRKRLGGNAR